MREFMRIAGGMIGALMALGGCGLMAFSLMNETLDVYIPIIMAVLGSSLLISGVLIYNNLGNEDLKELLEQQNEYLRYIRSEIETGNKNAVQIARIQHKEGEKREIQPLSSK